MSETNAERTRYDNPQAVIERYKNGEAESLTWAIREYIYRRIKEREAHGGAEKGQFYFECPRFIARVFGCRTKQVHGAVRLDDRLVRTGRDGDKRRCWMINPEAVKSRKEEITRAAAEEEVRRNSANLESAIGVETAPIGGELASKQRQKAPLKLASKQRSIREYSEHPSKRIKERIRPEGIRTPQDFPDKEGTGTGTGAQPAAIPAHALNGSSGLVAPVLAPEQRQAFDGLVNRLTNPCRPMADATVLSILSDSIMLNGRSFARSAACEAFGGERGNSLVDDALSDMPPALRQRVKP